MFLLPLAMASCVDTREELEIKNNGSGTLALKTDLGKMLEMVKNFGGDSSLTREGMDKPLDTVMLMKDYIDTVKDIPADQKALLRNGRVHVIMNTKENIGKLDMNFPFASADKLQLLYASIGSSSGGLKNLLGGMKNNMPNSHAEDAGGDVGMPQVASIYDIVVKDGLYSRKVNKVKYDAFTQAIKLDELKQMGTMFGSMNYTLQVKLPRPVKKITNSKATLSEDKKTATLSTDLMETFQHPELLSLDIEY